MSDRKFSKEHEWVDVEDGIATVGISDYAQEQLGDLVYIELPEVGQQIALGGQAAVVESVKAASEIYAPVSGEVAGMDIYSQDVDVFAPCALGAELNGRTIPRLKAQIVAGAANNQLERPEDGADLAARGILYAPDYVINAGGVINLSYERESGYDRARAMTHTARIHDVAIEIFGRAERESRPTSDIADDMAKELPAATG